MALVTLANLKARLGIASGDTSRDTDLEGIIAAAEGMVRKYLDWNPEVTGTQTAYLNPNGAETVVIRVPPDCPLTILTVHEDEHRVFGADTLLTVNEDYIQERPGSPVLIRLNRNWPFSVRRMPNRLAAVLLADIGTIKVTYTMDTADALAVSKRACLYECMAQAGVTYDGKGVGVVTTDSMDGASVTVNTNTKGSGGRKQNSADGFASPLVAGMLDAFRTVPVF